MGDGELTGQKKTLGECLLELAERQNEIRRERAELLEEQKKVSRYYRQALNELAKKEADLNRQWDSGCVQPNLLPLSVDGNSKNQKGSDSEDPDSGHREGETVHEEPAAEQVGGGEGGGEHS